MTQILLVDDSPDTCRILIRVLARHGHKTECVDSGRAAMEYLKQSDPPTLFIVDYMMPDMNGIEVLKRLRADPKTAAIPAVLYTANYDPQVAALAKQNGANEVWLKGTMGLDDVGNRVKDLLNLPTE